MSSNGGGGSNLLDMGLMVAAGVAAPELAPELMEGGSLGITGLTSETAATALAGAGTGALAGAITGKDPLTTATMGGIGGALSGALAPAADAINPATGLPVSSGSGLTSGSVAGDIIPQTPSAIAASTPVTTTQMIAAAAPNTLSSLTAKPAGAYTPPGSIYTGGNLQYFKYDPRNYQPDVVVPPNPLYHAQYAEGGIAGLNTGGYVGSTSPMVAGYAAGGKSNSSNMDMIEKYMSDYQSDPASVKSAAQNGDYNAMIALNKINNTPNQNYASGGGISDLGSYSDGGRLLKGPGDGMSDDIPAKIGGKQEARLADGEFVVPADVVSHLGNGSTDAGAKHLYKMMDKVRHARTGRKTQAKQIKAEKYLPA